VLSLDLHGVTEEIIEKIESDTEMRSRNVPLKQQQLTTRRKYFHELLYRELWRGITAFRVFYWKRQGKGKTSGLSKQFQAYQIIRGKYSCRQKQHSWEIFIAFLYTHLTEEWYLYLQHSIRPCFWRREDRHDDDLMILMSRLMLWMTARLIDDYLGATHIK
jgi:hypothetical protein